MRLAKKWNRVNNNNLEGVLPTSLKVLQLFVWRCITRTSSSQRVAYAVAFYSIHFWILLFFQFLLFQLLWFLVPLFFNPFHFLLHSFLIHSLGAFFIFTFDQHPILQSSKQSLSIHPPVDSNWFQLIHPSFVHLCRHLPTLPSSLTLHSSHKQAEAHLFCSPRP